MVFASRPSAGARPRSRRPAAYRTRTLSIEDLEGRLVPSSIPAGFAMCDSPAGSICEAKPSLHALAQTNVITGQQGYADLAVALAVAAPSLPTQLGGCDGPTAGPCAIRPAVPAAPPAQDVADTVAALVVGDAQPPEREPPTELWACAGAVRRVCLDKNGDPLPPALGQAGADAALVAALVAGNTATLTPQRPIPVFEPVAAQPANLPPTTTIGGDQPGPSGSTSIVDSAKIQ